MPERAYFGLRSSDGECNVTRPDGGALNPRTDLVNHSPDGFNWGYAGSGPAQLAFAILADHAGAEVAFRFYQAFKQHFIVGLPRLRWQITPVVIDEWLAEFPAGVPLRGDE